MISLSPLPEAHSQHAFVWYHGAQTLGSDLHHWLHLVHEQLGICGQLFYRCSEHHGTWMETYAAIQPKTLEAIEQLAKQQPCFQHRQRHAECFQQHIIGRTS